MLPLFSKPRTTIANIIKTPDGWSLVYREREFLPSKDTLAMGALLFVLQPRSVRARIEAHDGLEFLERCHNTLMSLHLHARRQRLMTPSRVWTLVNRAGALAPTSDTAAEVRQELQARLAFRPPH